MSSDPNVTSTNDETTDADDVTAHVFVDTKDTAGQSDVLRVTEGDSPEF